jgi:hypothetical protein
LGLLPGNAGGQRIASPAALYGGCTAPNKKGTGKTGAFFIGKTP